MFFSYEIFGVCVNKFNILLKMYLFENFFMNKNVWKYKFKNRIYKCVNSNDLLY